MEWKGGERVTCEVVHLFPYPSPLSLVGDVFGATNLFAHFEHGMNCQRQPLMIILHYRRKHLVFPRFMGPPTKSAAVLFTCLQVFFVLCPTSAGSKCAGSYGEQYGAFFFFAR